MIIQKNTMLKSGEFNYTYNDKYHIKIIIKLLSFEDSYKTNRYNTAMSCYEYMINNDNGKFAAINICEKFRILCIEQGIHELLYSQ